MISRFARACFLGGGASTAWVSSAGAAPNPSHPAGTAEVGAQPFPNAQQFASINAANRNKMHFAIIVTTYHRCNQNIQVDPKPEPLRFDEIEMGSKLLIWRAFSSRAPVSTPAIPVRAG